MKARLLCAGLAVAWLAAADPIVADWPARAAGPVAEMLTRRPWEAESQWRAGAMEVEAPAEPDPDDDGCLIDCATFHVRFIVGLPVVVPEPAEALPVGVALAWWLAARRKRRT